ncbi:hypothetical protein F5Y05DRAFT_419660 [Hypoxylon sp. FL0543]|nr:hypothetical protein F5Y05DRAFT_419660 [Hypoxylon sp. FL0543]
MVQGSKENLLVYIRHLDRYADDGEGTGLFPRIPTPLRYVTPDFILSNFEEWIDNPEAKEFYVNISSYESELAEVPHELLEELRDRRELPCTWFFGKARYYFGRDENQINPKMKMMVLLCTMIVQLADLVPETYDDVTGALTEEMFDDLDEMGANMEALPYSIPKLIDVVKGLAAIGPQKVFLVFDGCNDLPEGDEDLWRQLKALLVYLTEGREPQAEVSGRQWKILWIDDEILPS